MMDGWEMNGWGWGWMSLTLVVSVLLIVLLVVLIARVVSPQSRSDGTEPEDTHARRFAQGEIEENKPAAGGRAGIRRGSHRRRPAQ